MLYKLENNNLVPPPENGLVGGVYYGNLRNNETLQVMLGYKPVFEEERPDGNYIRVYSETIDSIICNWEMQEEPPKSDIFEISKYRLLLAIDSIGMLDVFFEFLQQDLRTKLLWDAAVTLNSNDDLLLTTIDRLKDMPNINITDEQIAELIEQGRIDD